MFLKTSWSNWMIHLLFNRRQHPLCVFLASAVTPHVREKIAVNSATHFYNNIVILFGLWMYFVHTQSKVIGRQTLNSAVDSFRFWAAGQLSSQPAGRGGGTAANCAQASAMTHWTSGTFGQVVDAALSSWVHWAIAKKEGTHLDRIGSTEDHGPNAFREYASTAVH